MAKINQGAWQNTAINQGAWQKKQTSTTFSGFPSWKKNEPKKFHYTRR